MVPHTANMSKLKAKPTGLLSTSSRLSATVNQMMVMIEFNTNEKNRFLCSVILWQLKLLREAEGNTQTTLVNGVE